MATNSHKSDQNIRVKVSAPGKVILHGEHSVVYNKLALAASLGLRTRLTLEETPPNGPESVIIEFSALQINQTYNLQDVKDFCNKPLPLTDEMSINLDFTTPDLIDHNELVKTVKMFVKEKSPSPINNLKREQALHAFFYLFFAILKSAELDLKPLKITIDTDLTVSAGTGSSASFSVVISAALIQYIKIKKLHQPSDFDRSQLDLISKWGFQAEKIIHGTPSGVDNTICTYGSLVEFRKGQTPKLVEISRKLNVILINTNVARDTKVQVGKVADFRGRHEVVADGVLELMEEVSVEAVECFKKINEVGQGDVSIYFEKLTELAEINHNLLRCLGVSHPKLDEAVQIVSENNLRGKLTGAGGGGYAICIVPSYITQRVVDNVITALNSRGFSAIFTDLGGSGVTID